MRFTGGYWGSGSEEAWAEAAGGINALRDGMRLISLSKDVVPDEGRLPSFGCCWARPRMWEQYADNRKGACLVFRRESFEEAMHAELGRLGEHYLQEVCYTPAGIAGSEVGISWIRASLTSRPRRRLRETRRAVPR